MTSALAAAARRAGAVCVRPLALLRAGLGTLRSSVRAGASGLWLRPRAALFASALFICIVGLAYRLPQTTFLFGGGGRGALTPELSARRGGPRTTLTRYLLADAAKGPQRAVCLDGTPGAYYHRPGRGAGSRKWFVHLQGGGWCTSLPDCAARADSDLGSSTAYPSAITADGNYFSPDESLNPMLATWHLVLVRYCDGGSWVGAAEKPATHEGVSLHFRGAALMDATIADLLSHRGLADASDVVLSGCSAGGLAVLLHADRWRAALPAGAHLAALADSGFFLDHDAAAAPGPKAGAKAAAAGPRFGSHMRWLFEAMRGERGADASCVAAQPAAEAWRCLFAEHALPHVATPVFLLQPLYDSWSTEHILGAPKTDAPALVAWGRRQGAAVDAALARAPAHGAFLSPCAHHCGGFFSIVVSGAQQAQAFEEWYRRTLASAVQRAAGEQLPPAPVWRPEPPCEHPCEAPGVCTGLSAEHQRRRRAGALYRGRSDFRIG